MVAGPTAGRSSRKSWPRLADLTNTPDPALQLDPAVGAQLGDAGQHAVGALGRFDGERALIGDDGALADVERRHGLQQPGAKGDVGERLLVRRRSDDLAALREQARREVSHADDAEALGLEQPGDAAQQRIVAAAKQFGDFPGALNRAPVRQEVAELGPGHGAEKADIFHAARLQRGEQLADLADAGPRDAESSRSRARPSRSNR